MKIAIKYESPDGQKRHTIIYDAENQYVAMMHFWLDFYNSKLECKPIPIENPASPRIISCSINRS